MNRLDFSKPFLVHSKSGRVLFYPWLTFFLFGAATAYIVSSETRRDSIALFLNRFNVVIIGILIASLIAGVVLGAVHIALSLALSVSEPIYLVCVRPHLANLQRLSAKDSCRHFARSWGAERLWQAVFLGILIIVSCVWFGVHGLSHLALVCFFCNERNDCSIFASFCN
jgi:hypothetical protein